MNYKEVIESRYNRQNWQHLLHDIFGSKIKFWNTPSVVTTSSPFAKQALWLGTITLSDEQTIAVYEVELAESVDIERNRRGIRDMLLTAWRNNGNAGAFMFCYRKNESVLRFSYVSEAWKFADDGSYQKESTDTRRFTYLLGEGHRSRTAIQQFEKLRDSQLSLKDLTKAFSVDAVSDMFFDGYKKQYENIIFYITGKRMVKVANKWEECLEGQPCQYIMRQFSHFPNPEKSIRDYVKKLMGRLVFLQFLQKKGWLGVGVHDEWGNGDPEFIQNLFASCNDKDHFIDKVLEPLFNDLNIEEGKKLPHYRTPYLNGGLFEREAADETDFPLPAQYMQSLLDFFASYNFTIDENDPDDAEVGVDPEMLGRIFENLLEDNKDKGAFYTPKEIVSYMCRESLIAYLQTGIQNEVTKEAIRLFVTTHQIQEHLPENIDQLLKDVKICDPAIGSGAFPMGLLKELFLCRTALEGISQHQAAEIKKHIIQQNVYGVDIERGAVDIARLRFWLSLIVDEETPQALPNLDFKIMQGNSLLEQYKGVDLSRVTKSQEATNDFSQQSFDGDLFANTELPEMLRDMLFEYYDCTDHKEKQNLRLRIIDNVKQQLKEQNINVDFGDLDLSGNDQFFLWQTWFYDVFSKGGFDIVIGNPPYFNVETLGAKSLYAEAIKKKYSDVWQDKSDILFYFIRSALSLSNNIICFITSNAFLFSNKAVKLRNRLIQDGRLKKIVNFEEYKVFNSASITTCISLMSNSKAKFRAINVKGSNYTMESIMKYIQDFQNVIEVDLQKDTVFALIDSPIFELNKKIDSDHKKLSEMFIIGSGMQTGANKVFCFSGSPLRFPKQYVKRRMSGEIINKYVHCEKDEYILYFEDVEQFEDLPKSIQNHLISNKDVLCERAQIKRSETSVWWKYTFAMHKELYNLNKLWCSYRCKSNMFTFDDSKEYIGLTNTTVIFDTNTNYSLKYLLALLNSKVLSFRYKSIGKQTGSGVFEYFENGVGKLPIPEANNEYQKNIVCVVDQIINQKKNNPCVDTTNLEFEIDRLVYQLYGLTYDEVLVVDPETPITREEYEG